MLNRSTLKGLRILALLGFSTTVSVLAQQQSGNDKDPGWHPTPADKIKLPQYCWSQYDANFARQSGIPSPVAMCGVYTNHLCPGYVFLNRARDLNRPMNMRREYIKRALSELQYTAAWMKPNCKLKPEADAAHAQAQLLARTMK